MALPCSIQLFPRVERRSIVYADGKEARSYRGRQYTAATIPGAGSRRLKPARAAVAAAAAVTIGDGLPLEVGGVGDGSTLGRGQGGSSSDSSSRSSSNGSGRGVQAPPATEAVAFAGSTGGEGDGADSARGRRRCGDAIRLIGEMDIDKPAYLQV